MLKHDVDGTLYLPLIEANILKLNDENIDLCEYFNHPQTHFKIVNRYKTYQDSTEVTIIPITLDQYVHPSYFNNDLSEDFFKVHEKQQEKLRRKQYFCKYQRNELLNIIGGDFSWKIFRTRGVCCRFKGIDNKEIKKVRRWFCKKT